MAPLVLSPSTPVFLVATPKANRTWLALHTMPKRSRATQTMVTVFADEGHARAWALRLEDHRELHDAYPARDHPPNQRRLEWMPQRAHLAGADRGREPRDLEVVRMTVAEVKSMLLGSGMRISIVTDPCDLHKRVDVPFVQDAIAARARLDLAWKNV